MNDDEMWEAAEMSAGPFADKPTAELLDLLCDEDEVTRHAAATALQKRGERAAFERGVELTLDERAYVREKAAFLLGQLGYNDGKPFSQESAPVLEGLLNDDSSNSVRASAAVALGHLNAKSALESLIRASKDEDAEIREAVAVALIGVTSPEALPVIEKLRKDSDTDVADWAELAMELWYGRKYEDETIESLCALLSNEQLDIAARKAVTEILGVRDEAAAWEWARAFGKSDSALLRLNAPLLANGLGTGKGAPPRADVIGMLIDKLRNDVDTRVRDLTAEVLAEFKGAEVLDALIAAAADPDWRVRWSVAFALSRHGEPESGPPLEKLCNDPDERVARYARERFDWMNGIFFKDRTGG